MAQPALGMVATAIVIAISLGYIALWDVAAFNGWIAFFALCFIPFEVITGVIWGGNPPFAAGMRQPVKGLVLLLVTLLVGAVVSQFVYRTLGASQGDPGPMLAFFSICVIVTTFFWTIAFGGWPFTAMIKNPLAAGIATWLGCYAVGLAIYWIFSDFTFLEGAPVYVASADPKGLFHAWTVPIYYMAALTILFAWLCLDLWPLTRNPGIMKQPTLGIVLVGASLVLGYALYYVGVYVAMIQNVEFLLRVPVAFIFGTIVVLNMSQNSVFKMAQPAKGILNIVFSAVVGSVLMIGYQQLQPVLSGPLPPGPEPFQREQFQVWTANAMLAVTFPFLVFYAAYFNFWPLVKPAPQEAPART